MNKYLKAAIFCILTVTILNIIGCSGKTKDTVKVIYLVSNNGGQLDKAEIEKYPEVISVTNMDELKKLATEKTVLWIDKDALDLLDLNWIQKKAESKVPIMLMGYNNALYSFRDKLSIFGIKGPYVDWSKEKLEPGFSVGMLKERTITSTSVFMKGYNTKPDVKQILSITNMLFDGKFPE
jgi:hypothetical protein